MSNTKPVEEGPYRQNPSQKIIDDLQRTLTNTTSDIRNIVAVALGIPLATALTTLAITLGVMRGATPNINCIASLIASLIASAYAGKLLDDTMEQVNKIDSWAQQLRITKRATPNEEFSTDLAAIETHIARTWHGLQATLAIAVVTTGIILDKHETSTVGLATMMYAIQLFISRAYLHEAVRKASHDVAGKLAHNMKGSNIPSLIDAHDQTYLRVATQNEHGATDNTRDTVEAEHFSHLALLAKKL